MREPRGRVRVIQGDMPVANLIAWDHRRLIAGDCRMDARIMELSLDGTAPRVIKDAIPMPNAFDVGPDGRLYAPIMGTNEIWAIDLASGAHDVVTGDLGVPDSVKCDSKDRIVSTQVASGQVLRLDVQSGTREVLADLAPGLDNVTFVGERGDACLADIEPGQWPDLYRLRTLSAAGIPLAAGSDAPFGRTDPWAAMAAAVSQRTASGRLLGESESLEPETALALFLADPQDLAQIRTIAVGAPADLCLLDRPWAIAREGLSLPCLPPPGL